MYQELIYSTMSGVKYRVDSDSEMKVIGEKIGQLLVGGEYFELIGDVGAGKTTLTKGIAQGLGIIEPVQSPTFTINRVYEARDGLELRHYDFYRVSEAGIMADELDEAINSSRNITIVEWGGVVEGVLPDDRLQISIVVIGELERELEFSAFGERSGKLMDELVGILG